jgi:hypothetical protein
MKKGAINAYAQRDLRISWNILPKRNRKGGLACTAVVSEIVISTSSNRLEIRYKIIELLTRRQAQKIGFVQAIDP